MLGAAATVTALACVAALVIRDRRLRRRLRECLHELRRPAQLLALTEGEDRGGALEQLAAGLDDLGAAVDGRPTERRRQRVVLDDLLAEASARWAASPVRFELDAPAAELDCDRVRLGMAIDNLIANGLEHGGDVVRVDAAAAGRAVRVEVRNPGAAPPRARRRRDPRRGHGLRLVGREIEAERGSAEAPRFEAGETVAAVELPRGGPGPEAA